MARTEKENKYILEQIYKLTSIYLDSENLAYGIPNEGEFYVNQILKIFGDFGVIEYPEENKAVVTDKTENSNTD